MKSLKLLSLPVTHATLYLETRHFCFVWKIHSQVLKSYIHAKQKPDYINSKSATAAVPDEQSHDFTIHIVIQRSRYYGITRMIIQTMWDKASRHPRNVKAKTIYLFWPYGRRLYRHRGLQSPLFRLRSIVNSSRKRQPLPISPSAKERPIVPEAQGSPKFQLHTEHPNRQYICFRTIKAGVTCCYNNSSPSVAPVSTSRRSRHSYRANR